MELPERIRLIKMIEKMNKHPAFSQKIGIRDVSVLQKPEKP